MKKKLPIVVFMLSYSVLSFAQLRPLIGIIDDEKGGALSGVSVRIKGTGNKVSTDINGTFSISAVPGAILVISAIGYNTQEQKIENLDNLAIVLKASNQTLNEVVITALDIKREKRTLAFTTQELEGAVLVNAKQDNLINDLAGKIAGVQITNSSGMPGSSSQVLIRGNSTLFGNNTALIVIDGVPVDNQESGNPAGPLSSGGTTNRAGDIDPNIVETITVLKGAAATVLYGSAGSRGVILITTKNARSEKGSLLLTFNNSYSFDNAILPKIQDEYAQGSNGQYVNGNIQGNYNSLSWGPRIDTLKVNGLPVKKRNNVKDFFKTGHTSDNDFSISSGSDNSNYLISYSYLRTDGTEPSTNYMRNALLTKYNTHLLHNLTLATQFNMISVDNHRLLEGNGLSNPLWTIYAAPISWNPQPSTNSDGTQQVYRQSRNNPYWIVNNSGLQDNTYRVIPVIDMVYTPLKWLTVTERLGADLYITNTDYHENVGTVVGDGLGELYIRENHFAQFNNDLIIESRVKLAHGLKLETILGNNIFSNYNSSNYVHGADLSIPGFYNISNTSNITASYNSFLKRKIGFYAQANLEYEHMLTLALTGRYDGTSVLSSDKQFYPYGSASAGFIFTEALGLSQSTLNFGKLRVSYSIVGNDDVAPYVLTNPYFQTTGFPIGGQNGFQITNVTAFPLKNETIKEVETGFETKFFKSRLLLDVTYYNKISSDLLSTNTPIAPSSGFVEASVNSGSIRNRGIEVILDGVPLKSANFRWDITINFAKNNNEVLKLAPGINFLQFGGFGNPGIFAYPNQPYGVIYGSHYLRNTVGQLLLSDAGYPQIAKDLAPIGNVTPKFITGMTNSFSYKSMSLSFVLDWKHGGDILNYDDHYLYIYGTSLTTENRGSSEIFPGIIQSTSKINTTSVILNQNYYSNVVSAVDESSVEDGSYIKLRQVTLEYNFRPFIVGRIIKKLTLVLTGTNFILHKNYTGSDPEVSLDGSGNGQGFANFVAPSNSSIVIGFKAVL